MIGVSELILLNSSVVYGTILKELLNLSGNNNFYPNLKTIPRVILCLILINPIISLF